jgi:Fe-S-cluster-containing dehydrogenase component
LGKCFVTFFLKIAGISVGVSVLGGSLTYIHASGSSNQKKSDKTFAQDRKAFTAKRWGMVIDTKKLSSKSDLESIIEACDKIHNIPKHTNKNHEIKWLWEDEFSHVFVGDDHEFLSDKLKHLPFLALCNQCKNPPCVRACPTNATFQREDGIVLMDFHRCIGCRFCMAACPYGSRSFNFVDPRPFIHEQNNEFPTRAKGVVEKCNFCAERLAVGKSPACVEASNGAIAVGDLEDPNSDVRKLLSENYTIRRKPSLGTEPSVYYIV